MNGNGKECLRSCVYSVRTDEGIIVPLVNHDRNSSYELPCNSVAATITPEKIVKICEKTGRKENHRPICHEGCKKQREEELCPMGRSANLPVEIGSRLPKGLIFTRELIPQVQA